MLAITNNKKFGTELSNKQVSQKPKQEKPKNNGVRETKACQKR